MGELLKKIMGKSIFVYQTHNHRSETTAVDVIRKVCRGECEENLPSSWWNSV